AGTAAAAVSGGGGVRAKAAPGQSAAPTLNSPSPARSANNNPPSAGIFSTMLPSALSVDITHETVTLPLYHGLTSTGKDTWYIVTESSDQNDATQRGVNYSNKLLNALSTAAVQNGNLNGETVVFDGTVNFGLTRVLVPDPVNGFPPVSLAPGAMGDASYSPLVHIVNGAGEDLVINAPQVANNTGSSGSVVD